MRATFAGLMAIVVALPLGCGDDGPQPPLGKVAVVRQDETPPKFISRSGVRVVSPQARAPIKAGDPIECRVELDLSGGEKLPQGVTLHLKRGGAVLDSVDAVLEEGGDGRRPRLVGRLKAPAKPGKYGVQAEVTDSVVVRSASGTDAGTIRPHRVESPVVDIEVTR